MQTMADAPPLQDDLSTDELRERLEARTRSIGDRVATLKHELTTVQDITVAGRPLLDYVKDHALPAAGIALASGLAVGLLTGFRARAHRRPELDERQEVIRLYVGQMLDRAAERVARGADPDEAVDEVVSRHPPLVYYTPPEPKRRTTVAETFDVAFKTAMGFGVKMALDQLASAITNENEIFEAVEEVRKDPTV